MSGFLICLSLTGCSTPPITDGPQNPFRLVTAADIDRVELCTSVLYTDENNTRKSCLLPVAVSITSRQTISSLHEILSDVGHDPNLATRGGFCGYLAIMGRNNDVLGIVELNMQHIEMLPGHVDSHGIIFIEDHDEKDVLESGGIYYIARIIFTDVKKHQPEMLEEDSAVLSDIAAYISCWRRLLEESLSPEGPPSDFVPNE